MWSEHESLNVQIYLYDGCDKKEVFSKGFHPNTKISLIEETVRMKEGLNPEWGICSIINQSVNVGHHTLQKFAKENKIVIIMKIQY